MTRTSADRTAEVPGVTIPMTILHCRFDHGAIA